MLCVLADAQLELAGVEPHQRVLPAEAVYALKNEKSQRALVFTK